MQPHPGHAARVAEHPELLDVRDLPHVDLLRELAQHRALDVLVVAEPAARQRPPPQVGLLRALPGEHLRLAVGDPQDGGEHLVSRRARPHAADRRPPAHRGRVNGG
jgi:hypothetical protein